MRKLVLTTGLMAFLMIAGLFNAPVMQPVLASVSPPDITYPGTYWNASTVGAGPHVNTATLKIEEQGAQISDIKTGDIDLLTDPSGIPANQIPSVLSFSGTEAKGIVSELGFRWLGFNFRVWANPALPAATAKGTSAITRYLAFRQAVDLAAPRQNTVATQLSGYGSPICEAVTPAWGTNYYTNSTMCLQYSGGAFQPVSISAVKAKLATLLGTNAGGGNVFTNLTVGCLDSMAWCFGNGTDPMKVVFNFPSYDPVRGYIGAGTASNMKAAGFDMASNPIPFASLVANEQAYTYTMMILAFGFSNNVPDWLYQTFSTATDLCPVNATAGQPGCAVGSSGSNNYGNDDPILDAYLNVIHTGTNFAAIVSATQHALFRLYTNAEYLGLYTLAVTYGMNNNIYSGWYNKAGAGTGDFSTILYEESIIHQSGADFWQSAVHPSDGSRPLTIAMSSDIGFANRWELSSVWDVIVDGLYEGMNNLNYLGPDNYALYPMTANVGTITPMTVDGVPGLKIDYTVNSPGAGMSGMPVWAANHQFVTVQDYANSLAYIKTTQPANFASLEVELSHWTVSGNTLSVFLNQTGYWKLYDTNIPPTYAPYWCDKASTGSPDCSNLSKLRLPTDEPTPGSADELAMMLASTTGPFVVTNHVPGSSFTVTRNTEYWLSPACDRAAILGNPCPAGTPVFGGSTLLMLLTLLAVPTALTIAIRRRPKN